MEKDVKDGQWQSFEMLCSYGSTSSSLEVPVQERAKRGERQRRKRRSASDANLSVSIVFSSPLDAFSYIVKEHTEFPIEIALRIKVGQCRRKATRTKTEDCCFRVKTFEMVSIFEYSSLQLGQM